MLVKEKGLCVELDPIWNHTHPGIFLKNLKLGVLNVKNEVENQAKAYIYFF